jgi:acyl-CoA synthetase (AMP-forming)/AMP-acid ligase II
VFGPSSPDYVATFYGVTAAGATITSLNVLHNVAELSYQLIDSGAEVLVLACEPSPAVVAASRKARVTRVWRLDDVRTEGGAGVDAGRDHTSSMRCTSENQELQVPSPKEYGIPEQKYFEVIPVMAAQALASGSPQNNPRVPTAEEIAQLYRQVWA